MISDSGDGGIVGDVIAGFLSHCGLPAPPLPSRTTMSLLVSLCHRALSLRASLSLPPQASLPLSLRAVPRNLFSFGLLRDCGQARNDGEAVVSGREGSAVMWAKGGDRGQR